MKRFVIIFVAMLCVIGLLSGLDVIGIGHVNESIAELAPLQWRGPAIIGAVAFWSLIVTSIFELLIRWTFGRRAAEVRTPTDAPVDRPRYRQRSLGHATLFAAMTSGIFGAVLGFVVIADDLMGHAAMKFLAEWWGLVGAIYLLTQIVPLISYNPLEERREMVDILTSPIASAVVFLVIPAVYLAKYHYVGSAAWPSWEAWKIEITSMPYSISDLALMLVLYRISRATVRTTPV